MKKYYQFIIVIIVISLALILLLGNVDNEESKQTFKGSAYFQQNLKTEHFIFHFNDPARIDEYSSFLEGFLDFINDEYLVFKYNYPINICILPNKREFKHFVSNKLNHSPDIFGIFLPSENTFYTYIGSGLGTLTHELMHPLIRGNLPNRPAWADEGIPTFFEKFFGYWDGDNLVIELGYQNPWRIRDIADELRDSSLERIVTPPVSNKSKLRLVSVFLHKNDLLKKYLQLVKNGTKKGYDTYIEAAFEKEFAEINPIWKQYLKEIYAHRKEIYDIPLSTILDNKKEYDYYVEVNNLNKLKKY